jgi:hypothetical protein
MFARFGSRCSHTRVEVISAAVAALAGVATVVASGRILLGLGEAGYAVFRPVLLFNAVMGVLYLAAATLILRHVASARWLAAIIALVNVIVLVLVVVLRASGGAVAGETVVAMSLRTALWLAIAAALGYAWQRRSAGQRRLA